MKRLPKVLSFLLVFALLIMTPGLSVFAADPTAKNRPALDLWMKLDIPRALSREEKTECSAPYLNDSGEPMVPLALVAQHMRGEVVQEGSTVTVKDNRLAVIATLKDGERGLSFRDGAAYVPLSEAATIFDLNSYYSEIMGVLALSEAGLQYDENITASQEAIFGYTAQFVIEAPDAKTFLSDAATGAGFNTHPRLMVTQDRFDELRKIYRATDLTGEYLRLQQWIKDYLAAAEQRYNSMFKTVGGSAEWKNESTKNSYRQPYLCYDENGAPILPDIESDNMYSRGDIPDRLKNDPLREYVYNEETQTATYTLYDTEEHGKVLYTSSAKYGDGYDYGERLNESGQWAIYMEQYAFSWQMTGEKRFADAVYLFGKQLGSWTTWGDGHFLNAADAASGYALGYDWTYHAFDSEPEKQRELAGYLYDHIIPSAYYQHVNYAKGVSGAAVSRAGEFIRMSRTRQGGCFFHYRINNWNFVCTSGTLLAALCAIEYPEYREFTAKTVEWVLSTFKNAMEEYVPDGAYKEGPGYWGYATRTLFRMAASMDITLGTNYGFMDSIGVSQTCYYIYNIANASGTVWPYHDCGRGDGDTFCMFYAAQYYDDPNLVVYRLSSIDAGCDVNLLDLLYFDPESVPEEATTSKTYYMAASDIVTMRSGWEKTSTLTGLHAGPSDDAHTDIDAGNFILEMGGIRWVDDGSNENYNIGDYFGRTRYFYFRKSAEAHATVMILSDSIDVKDHGQVVTTMKTPHAKLTRIEEYEHGSIAVADMTPQYGNVCESGTRAVMITADGAAVVVQDEIKFSDDKAQFIWNLPFHVSGLTVSVASDGRSATLTKGGKTLRATIVSDYKKLTFSYLAEGANPLLPGTVSQNSPANFNEKGECLYPTCSNTCQRLYIKGTTLHNFKFAVVFQLIETGKEAVYYELTDINSMIPVALSEFESGEDPTDPDDGKKEDTSKFQPSDLLAAIASMPDAEKCDALRFAEAVQNLYTISAALNPENPDTGAAKKAMNVYLADVADTIDEINEQLNKIERARKKNVLLPL